MTRLLEGVRVFELGIAIASPNAGRALAFHGAEVFKVESPTSPDVVRLLGSAWLRDDTEQGAAWPDSSPYVAEMNADKQSVALDLKHPGGQEAARRLLANCDVFLANFGARALADLGLDYESVREVKPDIVYVHLPGFGSNPDTPYYPFVAWGPNQAPLVGLDDLTGHAGREPAGIATVAPPDYLSSFHAAFAVLAGLEHRDRTGEGVHVDISQFETTISLLLGPFAMDHAISGNVQSRIGNRSLWYAPEGVYPCRGEERWIAISVADDDMWHGLVSLGPPGWATDERFATNEARLANVDALDEAVGAWTAGFEAVDLAARLQGRRVAAHVVATNEDILHDAHVMGSGFFTVRPGTRFRRDLFSGSPLRFAKTPGAWERAGPTSGEHTVDVLTRVAGMTDDEVAALMAAQGAFAMDDPDLTMERPYDQYLHVLFPGEAADARDL
jgi:benzylsuccinate CoA-transferase BbsF subunit